MRLTKKFAVAAAAGALIAASAFTVLAASNGNGQWCESNGKWWYKTTADGSAWVANQWQWIKDSDGVIRCYHFDANGYMDAASNIDNYTVDASGFWTENGKAVTGDENNAYLTTTVFADPAATTAAASATGFTGTTATTGASTYPTVGTAKTAAKSSSLNKKGNVKATKVTSIGAESEADNPANATFAVDYQGSSVSGSTVVNNWANFAMTLPAAPTVDLEGTGTDWYLDTDDGEIISAFIRIDNYKAGNTDINAFANSYAADARGFKAKFKGQTTASAGVVNLGAHSFIKYVRSMSGPVSGVTLADYCYIRQVEGTNYAQVITCEGADFASALATISRVR